MLLTVSVYQILEPSVIHGPHEIQRITGSRSEEEDHAIKRAPFEHWRPAPAVDQPTVAECAGVELLIVQGNRFVLECYVVMLHRSLVRGRRLASPKAASSGGYFKPERYEMKLTAPRRRSSDRVSILGTPCNEWGHEGNCSGGNEGAAVWGSDHIGVRSLDEHAILAEISAPVIVGFLQRQRAGWPAPAIEKFPAVNLDLSTPHSP